MKHDDGIVITRGDDSNAFNNTITIKIKTELDLTGYKAVLQIGKEQWIYDDISSKVISVVITKDESLRFREGTFYAALKLFEPNGLCKTVFRNIPVYVQEMAVKNPVFNEVEEPAPVEESEDNK